jgi:hypothetical protein
MTHLTAELVSKLKEEFGDFKIETVFNTTGFFFRFGGWRRVDINKLRTILNECGISAFERKYDDDDRGTLYSYSIL